MDYLRSRWYNAANGTFNRIDDYAGNTQEPQSLHKYAYCHGNPINGADPSGEFFVMSNWIYGQKVHDQIGYDFKWKYGTNGFYDRSVNEVLNEKVKWWGWNRPDLVNRPYGAKVCEVWEIKPMGQYFEGSAQLGWYLSLLNGNDPKKRTWVPGTSYTPPSVVTIDPITIAIITPPINGVIQYQVIDMKPVIAMASAYMMAELKMDLAVVSLRTAAIRVPF